MLVSAETRVCGGKARDGLRGSPGSGMSFGNTAHRGKTRAMDYKAAGAPKMAKKAPRHVEHNARGTDKNPYSKTETKAELLARMKAAAETRKGK
jgi:hypothetical protein